MRNVLFQAIPHYNRFSIDNASATVGPNSLTESIQDVQMKITLTGGTLIRNVLYTGKYQNPIVVTRTVTTVRYQQL